MGQIFGSQAVQVDMSSPSAMFVQSIIKQNAVAIFSKSSCPYCRMAKKVFDEMGTKYTSIELNQRDDGDEIQNILQSMTGSRTVPQVFVNGTCIGGGTDTKALYEKGDLKIMLEQQSNEIASVQ